MGRFLQVWAFRKQLMLQWSKPKKAADDIGAGDAAVGSAAVLTTSQSFKKTSKNPSVSSEAPQTV